MRSHEVPRIRVARAHARKLGASAGVNKVPVDVEAVADYLGLEIVPRRFPAEDRTSGALLRRDGSAIIVVNAAHAPVRKRFTIAHEIGHFVLHDDEVHVDQFRNEKSSDGTHAKEIEANAFAAELLMPEEIVTKLVGRFSMMALDPETEEHVKKVARQLEVSAEALTIRLATLGLLS